MKISPRRRSSAPPESDEREPVLLWWMPLPGILLGTGWAAWQAIQESGDSAPGTFAEALAWPGLVIFAVTTFAVWLAWKVEFE